MEQREIIEAFEKIKAITDDNEIKDICEEMLQGFKEDEDNEDAE